MKEDGRDCWLTVMEGRQGRKERESILGITGDKSETGLTLKLYPLSTVGCWPPRVRAWKMVPLERSWDDAGKYDNIPSVCLQECD